MTVDRRLLVRVFGPAAESATGAEDAARRSNRLFVYGEGQFVACEPRERRGPEPTGHRLSAWEAYKAFGLEVLDESIGRRAAIPGRSATAAAATLRRRRESLGVEWAQVARAAGVSEADARAAETRPAKVPLAHLSRIALALGLDERRLAFDPPDTRDSPLAVRLRTLAHRRAESGVRISPAPVLAFAEAASIVRIQHRLQNWLDIEGEYEKFRPDDDYGARGSPAWKAGYRLAEEVRATLGLGETPIRSMLKLVENRLGIPVVQTALPQAVAGATIAAADGDGGLARGIVLNIKGDNRNIWVRRSTLAHELGHLLFDPDARLECPRVDSHSDSAMDPRGGESGFAERRANAFAAAFLAPLPAVRRMAPAPPGPEAVAKTMREFGISLTMARYHVHDAHCRRYDTPSGAGIREEPSDEQTAAENFAIARFPLEGTSEQRRGRFAYLVARCRKEGILSPDTAALYLQCPAAELDSKLDLVTELFDISDSDADTCGMERIIDDIARCIPDSEWSRLPSDLSHRHDLYLSGGGGE